MCQSFIRVNLSELTSAIIAAGLVSFRLYTERVELDDPEQEIAEFISNYILPTIPIGYCIMEGAFKQLEQDVFNRLAEDMKLVLSQLEYDNDVQQIMQKYELEVDW